MTNVALARIASTGMSDPTQEEGSHVIRFHRGIWCAIALVGWLGAAAAQGDATQLGQTMRLDEVQGGTLLFPGATPGEFVPAPTLESDVAITVTGMIVRAMVTQRFTNPTAQWLEGVYVFPLPETAAVDHLRMLVGPRIIEGQIREREEAAKVYAAAKAEGRKASLVEQERPNIFTTSVANIGPGESIEITIEYQDAVPFDGREFLLRFPMTVAPRYIPGAPTDGPAIDLHTAEPLPSACFAGRAASTDAVPDADRITPPMSLAATNPVRLAVELDAGMDVQALYSPSHAITTQQIGAFVHLVTLADEVVAADRDFVLVWAPDAGALPAATLLAETVGGATYALLMVMPADPHAASYRIARETVFVVDTSGSMAGQSIAQAKLALLIALDRLEPGDRFNIIRFSDTMSQLFEHSAVADDATLDTARRWIDALVADGGTEMLPALTAALADAAAPGEVRQVIFVTDGQIGDEDALFAAIETGLGDSRLFTVGIGSAPNAHFMRKAAQFGRGTFTYVGSANEVSARMDVLFHKLDNPQLAGIEVEWAGAAAEVWPARLPDLYAGEPLVIVARLDQIRDGITLRGSAGDTPWQVVMPRPTVAADGSGIGQLWARRKIEALMDQALIASDAEKASLRKDIIEVALAHHLVSRHTSLVAVDVTPTRPGDATLLTRDVPVSAPFGSALALPSTATPAPLYAVLALLSLITAFMLRTPSPARERAG